MSAYPQLTPPPRPLPAPPVSSYATPAWIREDGHGGAVVTMGQISCPYANAASARAQLEAMARRGDVRLIDPPEVAPC